jgi:hypothetical protein
VQMVFDKKMIKALFVIFLSLIVTIYRIFTVFIKKYVILHLYLIISIAPYQNLRAELQ